MAGYWFSPYTGEDWEPSKGYNSVFAEVVRAVRFWFRLSRVKPGFDVGSGHWVEYQFSDQSIFVGVDRFFWDRFTTVDGFISIQFILDFSMSRGACGADQFFKGLLIIQFPEDYPLSMPFFRLKNAPYTAQQLQQGDESHHLLSKGWMCLLENPKTDWKPDRDTIITAINLALHWSDLHFRTFGW